MKGDRAVDLDGDGVTEIRVDSNTCTPTCADANYVSAIYRWNGHDYGAA